MTAAPTPAPSSNTVAGAPPPTGNGSGGSGEKDTFTLGGTTPNEIGATMKFVGVLGMAVEWGVPAFVMGVPGMLLILVVLAQILGGSAWLPMVRRRIGSLGIRGPRVQHRT